MISRPFSFHLLQGALLALVALLVLPAVSNGQVNPRDRKDLTAEVRHINNWQDVKDTWAPWPIVRIRRAPDSTQFAIYPLLTISSNDARDRRMVDTLWPLSSWRHRKDAWGVTERTDFNILPVFYSGHGIRNGQEYRHRFLIPFYWEGKDAEGGRYFMILPFIWHARDADLVVPLFPPRKQNFSAFWPIKGEFRGYWNWDTIRFILWPVLVRSTRGEGAERMELISVVWPITGYYRGANVKGFRLWPLVSYVDKRDKTRRAYWLWPLGRYILNRGKAADGGDEKIVYFFPFYGHVRTDKLSYDALFPFYGRLEMGGRRSRGWALATYMEDDNLRTGLRTHRILWFLIRWTSRIEVPERFEERAAEAQPLEGGGFFPFYVRRTSPTRDRMTVLWPFYHRRVEVREDQVFRRNFLVPVWGLTRREFNDGTSSSRGVFFPFYRHWRDVDGHRYQSAPHLFPYARHESADRNWAPFWTMWSRRANEQTGEVRIRYLGGLWVFDRNLLGDTRKRWNIGLLSREVRRDVDAPMQRDTHVLFGVLGLHERPGRTSLSLLGMGRPKP
jgi:hypothetical protein